MDIVVFGAGSLGSLIGGLLARAHDVTLVGRDPHVSAVRERGLRVVAADPVGADSFAVEPRATTDGTGLTADLAVVTVKATDTATAAEELATGEFRAALSLQNGMGNEDVLADALSCPALAGTTTLGAVRTGPGEVEWRGDGETAIGAWTVGGTAAAGADGDGEGGADAERADGALAAERAVDAFRRAGVEATAVPDIRARLWEKLAVNAAINPATALARADNGAFLRGDAGELAASAAREAARVARAEGVDLPDETAVAAVERVARSTAENRSSMRQDVETGRRTEIDAITGYVVERAERRDVPAPVNRTLLALVREWERARGLR